MQAGSRSYALAGAAIAALSAVTVSAVALRPSDPPTRTIDTRLVDVDGSLLNVPVNLLYDVVNIPFNEVQALNTAADSLFFNNNIFVVGAANLFGIDPGDPGHVAAIDALSIPLPAFTDGDGGLDYQITGLLASEIPTNLDCGVMTCYPILPADVVTGVTSIDRDIGFVNALGDPDFGLFRNWFTVPLTGDNSLLGGYTFSPDAPGSTVSGPVFSGFGFNNGDPNFFLGGTVDPETGAPAYDPTTGVFDPNATTVPWAGNEYTLNLFQPFENFYNSLLDTPSTDGVLGTGIESFTLTDVFQALQADAAAFVVTFNPFQPGSPLCPGDCQIFGSTGPLGITLPIVQGINSLTPGGNPAINEFLTAVAGGYANIPTQTDIDYTTALLQTGIFTFAPDTQNSILDTLGDINPALPNLFVNTGILTDPGFLAVSPGMLMDPPVAEFGGVDPQLVFPDLLALFGGSSAATDFAQIFDPAALDPSAFASDLSAMFGASLAPDLASIATSAF